MRVAILSNPVRTHTRNDPGRKFVLGRSNRSNDSGYSPAKTSVDNQHGTVGFMRNDMTHAAEQQPRKLPVPTRTDHN